MKQLIKQLLFACCLFGTLVVLGACASGPAVVDHAFGFDARVDSPDAVILDYRYGDYFKNSPMFREQGLIPQSGNSNGPMPLGDTLYVKWRIKSTGQEFEDTVNLKSRLPSNMERQRVYFVVQGAQLYVYLTDLTKPKPEAMPIVGPFRVQSYVTRQIYPDTTSK
ncbi:hypothetical protein [Rhodoferax sp.]|uniref:hypothetical protein n=1 Tax=Rhodoferax sp. TaxID=50421 RepID=UPI00271C9EBC|nr:hypothetical protein [Rhodoferax sp.]MDO9195263.1 hypothetical protein [Rhodoferax sp.]